MVDGFRVRLATVEDHVRRLADDAALWSVQEASSAEVVEHACEALVDGLDSQALRELAGMSPEAPPDDLEDLLRQVAADFGFPFYRRESDEGRAAASCALARECVGGRLPPRELTRWMHSRIRHGHEDNRVEALVALDDDYDIAVRPSEEIDRAVVEAARRLLGPM